MGDLLSQNLTLVPPSPAGAREPGGSPWLGRRSPPSDSFRRYQDIERTLMTLLPMQTALSVAPATAIGAFHDWLMHWAMSPAKQWEMWQLTFEHLTLGACAAAASPVGGDWCIEPLPQDKRFADPAWRNPPFSLMAQLFLLRQAWWHRATTGVPGVSRHHEQMVEFAARQWLDMVSPSNSVLSNPVVLQRTLEEGGMNLLRGAMHAAVDLWGESTDRPPLGAEQYTVGVDVAATPGQVIVRNQLMELIQYAPTTPGVHPEPVLLVPAWIMKYYILDLEQHNSMVRFLLDHGFTVFAISWKNPRADERDLGLDDYYRLGVRAALDAIAARAPQRPVHAVGYCLGGTLLSMAAAALGRDRSKALKTITLLAAQTDFTDPGELSLFIDESQVAWLESQMAVKGFLDKHQMKNAFQLLRSRDLVWSYRLATYLLGERAPVSALMAWNADSTRLPWRMHSDYLRALYLDNALAHGEFYLEDVPINLSDIRVPIFTVGTVQDHVAPWRSVFKLHHLTNADQTFVLTAGGHNVGVVNPPGQIKASYRLRQWQAEDRLLTPDEWMTVTEPVNGSWWTPWIKWLARHSSPFEDPPPAGLSLGDAPGRYVFDK